MDANQAKDLLQRYLEGEANSEEKLLVESWYNQLVEEGEWHWGEGEKKMLQSAMERRLLESIGAKQTPVRSIKKYVWIIAAATIILMFGAGAYFMFFRSGKNKNDNIASVSNYKNDVAPGGNNAILTLGNGKQIILDSAQIGELAKQGNANIIKTDSGKLAYDITNEKPTEVVFNVLTTPRKSQYHLTLSDGSEVWLNAESSIRYPTAFTGKEREVEITGEAYFEIVHNDKQPFKVKANSELIEDIGTHFNVSAYANEPVIKTTLLEGSVKVNGNVLKPGQQAQGSGSEIKIVEGADLEQAVAWKNGLFKFKETNIKEIMRQAERWYDVEVEFSGNVDNLDFGGIVSRKAYVSELLKLLETTGTIHFKIDGKKIIVSP